MHCVENLNELKEIWVVCIFLPFLYLFLPIVFIFWSKNVKHCGSLSFVPGLDLLIIWFNICFTEPQENNKISSALWVCICVCVFGIGILLYIDNGVPVLSAGLVGLHKCFPTTCMRIAIKRVFFSPYHMIMHKMALNFTNCNLVGVWLFLSEQAAYISGSEHRNWTPTSETPTPA